MAPMNQHALACMNEMQHECYLLGIPEHEIHVIAPDVGGGFGPKTVYYVEEALIALVTRLMGRPAE